MSSLGELATRLTDCRAILGASQLVLDDAVAVAEEVRDTFLELGVRDSSDRAEEIVDALYELRLTLEQAAAGVDAGIMRVNALMESDSTDRPTPVAGAPIQKVELPQNLTDPSGPVHSEATAGGQPEKAGRRSRRDKQEAIEQQNQTAKVLSEQGYRVRQLPRSDDASSPDFEIEGRIFDCYSPRNDTPLDNMRSKMRQKIKKGQAERFVVNLDQSRFTENDLRTFLARTAPSGLQEVLVVKDSKVSRVWP